MTGVLGRLHLSQEVTAIIPTTHSFEPAVYISDTSRSDLSTGNTHLPESMHNQTPFNPNMRVLSSVDSLGNTPRCTFTSGS
jgi:hypothetical protein